ncbi:MAG: hypothetical protein LBG87_06085 [Spirochaetaceae bacterium]|jgi:hypothetical protein|nr:hypothetical protein [Spirochaetaceae bacterium]
MIFDFFGSKKKSQEEIEQEREAERAWALYGKEVDAYLTSAKLDQDFKDLEKSKAVSRPSVRVRAVRDEDTPLSLDLKLRIKRGAIQESKAYRFMLDPEFKALLAAEGHISSSERVTAQTEPALSADLKGRVARGEIQGSKARRFMTDPALRALLPKS